MQRIGKKQNLSGECARNGARCDKMNEASFLVHDPYKGETGGAIFLYEGEEAM